MRVAALAERAGISEQSMGQLARDLGERGYVERVRDAGDARAVLIRLTDLGRRLLADARDAKVAVEAEYATILGEDGMRRLTGLLRTLADRLA